jgi:flagellar biosynthesis component FlhA
LFVIFLLVIVCYFSFGHCLSFFLEKWQTMTKRKMTNNEQKKNDKQWSKEKWQTMIKRKMTNNEQKKNDKQWSKEKWQTMIKRKMAYLMWGYYFLVHRLFNVGLLFLTY